MAAPKAETKRAPGVFVVLPEHVCIVAFKHLSNRDIAAAGFASKAARRAVEKYFELLQTLDLGEIKSVKEIPVLSLVLQFSHSLRALTGAIPPFAALNGRSKQLHWQFHVPLPDNRQTATEDVITLHLVRLNKVGSPF
jgi:hypothetical protein